MKISFEWTGPEEDLGTNLVTARRMTICEIEDKGDTLTARGDFTFHDYVEGSEGTRNWVAKGTHSGGEFKWEVRRKDPTPGSFRFTDKDSEEPLFCLLEVCNDAIKTFVADKLTKVVARMRANPGETLLDVREEPKRYSGEMRQYSGPCCCHNIADSRKWMPFNWENHTDGGKYPKNCFRCSCGQRWFRCNPEEEAWAHVDDELSWNHLTEFDGEMIERFAFDPSIMYPTIVLLSTLRRRGFIPIN